MNFIRGQKVKHIYTNEDLWILRVGNEQVLCRTKDLREVWFYPEELMTEDCEIRENFTNKRFL